jgi:hypothetical protein
MITTGSPYFVWINANEIISSWYLLGAVCVTPPRSKLTGALASRGGQRRPAAEPAVHRVPAPRELVPARVRAHCRHHSSSSSQFGVATALSSSQFVVITALSSAHRHHLRCSSGHAQHQHECAPTNTGVGVSGALAPPRAVGPPQLAGDPPRVGPGRGRRSHADAALYTLCGESLMQCTGRCQSDVNTPRLARARTRRSPSWRSSGRRSGRSRAPAPALRSVEIN